MTPDPEGSGHAGGLLEHARALLAAALEYLEARLTLAGIEAKEALLHFGIIIGLLVLGLVAIIFGYLFFFVALTLLLAQVFGIAPGWVILGLCLLHFAVAAGAVIFAATRLRMAVFSATLAELRKDRQWLNQTSK
jgi:uncharacterized membrane protein YqjE